MIKRTVGILIKFHYFAAIGRDSAEGMHHDQFDVTAILVYDRKVIHVFKT